MDYILDDKDVSKEHRENTVAELEPVKTTPTAHGEDGLNPGLNVKMALQHGADLDNAVVRKLLWKVDRRLITALGLLYCFSLIDRNNLPIVSQQNVERETYSDEFDARLVLRAWMVS